MENRKELFIRTKGTAIIVLILIASVFAAYSYVASVKAQNQATVNVLESIGGSTDPLPGTYSFNDGTLVALAATPDQDLVFESWLISTDTSNDTTSENPYTLTVAGGVTYTISAVFAQLTTTPIFPSPQPPPLPLSAYGSVTILQSVGGHTQPAAGTRFFTSVYRLTMTAVADSGWTFDHWVISGDTNTEHGGYPFTLTPENNPYTFDCGLGYEYAYQPVFVPVDSGNGGTPPPTTTGGLPIETMLIAIALVIAILVAAIGGYSYGKRSKK